MPYSHAAVSVGASATLVLVAPTSIRFTDDSSPSLIYNNDASKVLYVGGPNVTTALGIPVAAGAGISLPSKYGDVYAVVGSGTCDVRVLRGD